ncbi:hypothetical protein [Caulobacter segnis]|uniref:Uncharacterized protein n=1 Tax=Caulobacter segnis TaxID=88688 RepID=A0A2W5UX05_9CAUL|nr:hypothetical protein [Caulobacter segnis]PZR32299.1 MAG: hypothetical protein DI526_17140 [Caulobacter segnis]
MSAARDRLASGYYNSQPKTVDNPGGMDNGGHVLNFPLALDDLATVFDETVADNDATQAAIEADNNATQAAIEADNDVTRGEIEALRDQVQTKLDAAEAARDVAIGSAMEADGSAALAEASKNAAAASEAVNKRVVANAFPDRLDATGSWFSEAAVGDPAALADPTPAAIVNVAGYGFEYRASNAQATLYAKGVLSAAAGKVYEIEAEIDQAVVGGGETPAARLGLQGLDAAFASTGAQAVSALVATPAGPVTIVRARFGYAAPAGGVAWPQPGVSVWLRPFVTCNRKADNSGPVTACTARIRRLTVRDVTAVVAAEIKAAEAAASAASVAVASQADAESGIGPGLMSATRVGQAIAAQALSVGDLRDSATPPGARFLRCDGAVYLNSAYPGLRAALGPYRVPLVVRKAATARPRIWRENGLWLAQIPVAGGYELHSSPDLVTWTQRVNPFGTGGILKIVYGAGLYLALDEYGSTWRTSPDLTNWTTRALPTNASTIYDFAWSGVEFVAVHNNNAASRFFSRSLDGIAWTVSATTSTYMPQCVAYGAGGKWVAAGTEVYVSADRGVTWTLGAALSFGIGTRAAGSAGAVAFITGSSGVVWTTNGVDFSGQALPQPPRAITFDGAGFVISSSAGLRRTTDFVTFEGAIATPTDVGDAFHTGTTVNDPYVIATSAGVQSGLDLSTTQFQVPTIAAATAYTSVYIKAY